MQRVLIPPVNINQELQGNPVILNVNKFIPRRHDWDQKTPGWVPGKIPGQTPTTVLWPGKDWSGDADSVYDRGIALKMDEEDGDHVMYFENKPKFRLYMQISSQTRTLTLVLPMALMKMAATTLVHVPRDDSNAFSITSLIHILTHLLSGEGGHIHPATAKKNSKAGRKRGPNHVSFCSESEHDNAVSVFNSFSDVKGSGKGESMFWKTEEGTLVKHDRFSIDIETICGDTGNFTEPLFLIYHINIYDPRIDLHYGLKNLIAANQMDEKSAQSNGRTKKVKLPSKSPFIDKKGNAGHGKRDSLDRYRKENPFTQHNPSSDLTDFSTVLRFICTAAGFGISGVTTNSDTALYMMGDSPPINEDGDLTCFNIYELLDRKRMFNLDSFGHYDIFSVLESTDIEHIVENFSSVRQVLGNLPINSKNVKRFRKEISEAVCQALITGIEIRAEPADIDFDENGQFMVEASDSNFAHNPHFIQSHYSSWMYIVPNRVVRIRAEYIKPNSFINFAFPHCHSTVEPAVPLSTVSDGSVSREFPIMSTNYVGQVTRRMDLIEKEGAQLETAALDISIGEYLRKNFFNSDRDNMYCRTYEPGKHVSVKCIRNVRDNCFIAGNRYKRGEADKYPPAEAAIFKYAMELEKQNNKSLFVDFNKLPGFIKYKNMSPLSTFVANFSLQWLEKGVFYVSNSHREMFMVFILVPCIYKGIAGESNFMYPCVFIGGATGTGKSHASKLPQMFITDSHNTNTSSSRRAGMTGGMQMDKMILIGNDVNSNEPMFGELNAEALAGNEKTTITSGYNMHRTNNQGTLEEKVTYRRSFICKNGNQVKLGENFVERYHHINYTNSMKVRARVSIEAQMSNEKVADPENERALRLVFTKFQIFCCLIGNWEREGAITFHRGSDLVQSIVMDRYKEMQKKTISKEFQTFPRFKDQVHQLSIGFMMLRIYCYFCYGLVEGININDGCTWTKLRTLVEPMLIIAEEDVYMALSYFLDKFESFSADDLINAIVKHYSYDEIVQTNEGIQQFFPQNFERNGLTYALDSDGLKDFNVVDLTEGNNPFFPGANQSFDEILKQKAEDLGVSVNDLRKAIQELKGKTVSYSPLVMNQREYGVSNSFNTASPNIFYIYETSERSAKAMSKMYLSTGLHTRGKRHKITILSAVLKTAVGRQEQIKQGPLKDFPWGAHTNALMLTRHSDMRKRDILLPGKPFRNPVSRFDEKYSCCFEILKAGKPDRGDHNRTRGISPKLRFKVADGRMGDLKLPPSEVQKYIEWGLNPEDHKCLDSYALGKHIKVILDEYGSTLTDLQKQDMEKEIRLKYWPITMERKFLESNVNEKDYLKHEIAKLIDPEEHLSNVMHGIPPPPDQEECQPLVTSSNT